MKETTEPSYTAEDIRFTTNNGSLYAIVLKWPEDNFVRIHSLGLSGGLRLRRARLIGSSSTIAIRQADDLALLSVPTRPANSFAYVFKLSVTSDGSNAIGSLP